MFKRISSILVFIWSIFCFQINVFGQDSDVKIEYSSKLLKKGENFSIKITIKNQKEWKAEGFPEIKGFKKTSKSISHSQIKLQNKVILQHNIVQNYLAIEDGQYETGQFDLQINNTSFRQESLSLIIGDPKILELKNKTSASTNLNLETGLEGNLKEDVKLILNVDKKVIYESEGVLVNVSLFVSDANSSQLEFPSNINQQVEQIAKDIKPENCIEYRTTISKILGYKQVINNISYTSYKLFESLYFPINKNEISFNKTNFQMKTGPKLLESINLQTQNIKLQVKPLPEHPLKDKVCVGSLSLSQNFESKSTETGKVVDYIISVTGKGNNSKVVFNEISNDANFDFFTPVIRNSGTDNPGIFKKTFIFKIYPKQPGRFELGPYFNIIYFNTSTAKYDTLVPTAKLLISGNKIKNTALESGDIYDNIYNLDSSKEKLNLTEIVKFISNSAIVLMLIGMMFIFDVFKRKK